MYNICIVNAHWSNHGDEAALMPIINFLVKKNDNCHIEIIFKDKNEIKGFPSLHNVSYYSSHFLISNFKELKKTLDNNCGGITEKIKTTISNSDLVIYSPGGAVISDRFWWKKQLEYMFPLFCAKKYNKPVVFAAPSIGPFDKNFNKNKIRKDILDYCDKVCIREQISVDYLSSIGVTKNVLRTIDTAFYDDFNVDNEEYILNSDLTLKRFLDGGRVVALTISDFKWHVKLSRDQNKLDVFEKTMKNFVSKLVDDGYKILFIPQLFGNQNDKDYLKKFLTENCLILDENYDTYFQQYIISKCFALVGMRYHSNIFAAKGGTPFIAIGYEEKMVGFMRDYSLDGAMIRIDDFSNDSISQKWDYLISNYDIIRTKLKYNRERWREKASITINTISRLIDSI